MNPVAVVHELVLPTKGKVVFFSPWMAEIMTLLERWGGAMKRRVREIK
jgi:hypothetical protein